MVLKKTGLILLEDFLVLLLGLNDPGERWMFSEPDLTQRVSLFHPFASVWVIPDCGRCSQTLISSRNFNCSIYDWA